LPHWYSISFSAGGPALLLNNPAERQNGCAVFLYFSMGQSITGKDYFNSRSYAETPLFLHLQHFNPKGPR